jgi:thiol-disulfide isomerase/thioredoxin
LNRFATAQCALLIAPYLLSATLFSGQASAASLALELPQLDGRAFYRLSDEPGRPLLLNFWDTDCPPCVREMPLLDQFAKAHPGVGVIGINVISRAKAKQFLLAHPVGYRQLAGPADPSALLRRFGNPLGALPHTVVLDAAHRLCASKTGEISAEWLEKARASCVPAD